MCMCFEEWFLLCYGLNLHPSHPPPHTTNSYVKALAPNVTAFVDKICERAIKVK